MAFKMGCDKYSAILFCVLIIGGNSLTVAEQPIMTVTEMIEYWGYPVEEHEVTTDDGYILTLHRVPGGSGDRPPVFIGHCLTCTSAMLSFGPPENDLTYMLSDAGYDVWLGNIRGNTWSQEHVSLDPEDPEFWAFDWDTTATHDYPAMIDYVLQETGSDDLFYVGYSMGTTQYFAFLADLPDYNDKVRAGFMLAPAVFMGNAFNPIFELAELADELQNLFHEIGIYEFLPHTDLISAVGHNLCDDEHPTSEDICVDIMSGFMPGELINASMISFYLDHAPGGSTTDMFVHYAQLFLNPDKFVKYDYGVEGNLDHYGQEEPPEYDLSLVTAPTALFVGDSDGLASVADNDLLAASLPNLLAYEIVDYPGWTHLAFAAATNAGELVHSHIIDYMEGLL